MPAEHDLIPADDGRYFERTTQYSGKNRNIFQSLFKNPAQPLNCNCSNDAVYL